MDYKMSSPAILSIGVGYRGTDWEILIPCPWVTPRFDEFSPEAVRDLVSWLPLP